MAAIISRKTAAFRRPSFSGGGVCAGLQIFDDPVEDHVDLVLNAIEA
jgi:hypothetical protein